MVPREIEDAPRIEWREHIIAQLKKLCDIKRRLDNVPPAKKKAGVTAKLKRAFRPRGGRRKKRHYTRKQRRNRYKKRKTINGEKFTNSGAYPNKKVAQERAASWKKMGFKARVLDGTGKYKNKHVVWTR